MDNQNRKLELLGNAPIPKALLAMGIPTMIGIHATPNRPPSIVPIMKNKNSLIFKLLSVLTGY